jgi:hypothetical protein
MHFTRQHFGYEVYSYGTETKIFGEPKLPDGTLTRLGRNEGVRKMQTADRKAVVGLPDLESLTTSHIERAFLSVRQELKQFQHKGLGYSKDLETHKLAGAVCLEFTTSCAFTRPLELRQWLQRVLSLSLGAYRRCRGNDGRLLPSQRGREVTSGHFSRGDFLITIPKWRRHPVIGVGPAWLWKFRRSFLNEGP